MLAGAIVSSIGLVAALLLLFLRRFISEKHYNLLIQVLFAFACGALLGETMLHIMP